MCVCVCVCVCVYTHTHIHTTEYYSAMKKNETLPLATTWMDLKGPASPAAGRGDHCQRAAGSPSCPQTRYLGDGPSGASRNPSALAQRKSVSGCW